MSRLAILMSLLLVPSMASAKDLRKRVGVGYQNQLSEIPSISVKVGLPAESEAVNIQLGVSAGASILDGAEDRLFVGGRVLYGFVAEDNMNLYASVGAGFLQVSDLSGVRLQPAMGAEFFFFGLENLGVSAEWGVNLDYLSGTDPDGASRDGALDIYTVSGAPTLGLHYYF